LETFDAIASVLDVREYADRPVSKEVKFRVLEAGRLTGSGSNRQHWRFLLLQKKEDLKKLAQDSKWGKWVEGSNFAIVILTDPKLPYHMIDAGRSVQDMKLAAWDMGVASGVFTSIDEKKLRSDFGIPQSMDPTITVGFGYPKRKITGKRKQRNALSEVSYIDRYDNKFDMAKLI
jgi:nitroreductase